MGCDVSEPVRRAQSLRCGEGPCRSNALPVAARVAGCRIHICRKNIKSGTPAYNGGAVAYCALPYRPPLGVGAANVEA